MMGPGIAGTLALGGVRATILSRTEEGAAIGLDAARRQIRLLKENGLGALQDALQFELDTQADATGTADFREGIAAFLGKREAHFTGR